MSFAASTCSMNPNIHAGRHYLEELTAAIRDLDSKMIDNIVDVLFRAYRHGKTVFVFGNGGSAALASHIACDLGKGITFATGKKRLRVMSLTDNVALLTAWANDVGYESVFAEQLGTFVAEGDVVFAISGSGNSKNVLEGLAAARNAGARTVGVTGFLGGKMKPLCDTCLVVPSDNMQVIEDVHSVVAHAVATILRNRIVAVENERVLTMTAAAGDAQNEAPLDAAA